MGVEKEPGTEEYNETDHNVPMIDDPREAGAAGHDDPRSETGLSRNGDLPVEASGSTKESGDPLHLGELIAFHYYGLRPEESGKNSSRPVPALAYPYRDLHKIRHDYPLCITQDERVLRSLSEIVDDIIDSVDLQGDAREVFRRHLYQLESGIKQRIESDGPGRLGGLWEQAVEDLTEGASGRHKGSQQLRDDLIIAKRILKSEGNLIPCNEESPRLVLEASATAEWRARVAEWTKELDAIIGRLREILDADFSRSPEAKRAEHLRAASASRDDMDFDTLSAILGESHLGDPLPEPRRERVRRALETLQRVRPVFESDAAQRTADMPFEMAPVVESCETARYRWTERVDVMMEFFKAVQIARLEIDNQYREEIHDSFFENVAFGHLSDAEKSLIPPVIVILSQDGLAARGAADALGLLGSEAPFKVMVVLEDLAVDDRAHPEIAWPARTAAMALSIGHAFVMQAPVSKPSYLRDGFLAGLGYYGPALFTIYAGNTTDRRLPRYLDSAAAVESRVFPTFRYDPALGATWADRIDLTQNPQAGKDWPVESFDYLSASGERRRLEVAFTPADWFCADLRWPAQFWRVPPEKWHSQMVPLHEYRVGEPSEEGGQVPYLTVVDESGELGRVVPTRAVVTAMERCGQHWRQMQDICGIKSSFVARAINQELQRLESEKKQDVEGIEDHYRAELDRNVGELTLEIIQRIAQRLVSDSAGPVPVARPLPSAPPQKAVPDTEDVVATAAVEEEADEEVLVFDDPYIDTPLCTTCNECTNLNGQMFAYNENKQAYIKDANAGTFRDLVIAAEKCPVHIIHPGKPKNPTEPGLDELLKRAAPYNG